MITHWYDKTSSLNVASVLVVIISHTLQQTINLPHYLFVILLKIHVFKGQTEPEILCQICKIKILGHPKECDFIQTHEHIQNCVSTKPSVFF